MPRTASVGGRAVLHALNRGNGRLRVFHKDGDYEAIIHLLAEPQAHQSMRLPAYCLMPNHFHMVVCPEADGDLSRWVQWLMNAHVFFRQRERLVVEARVCEAPTRDTRRKAGKTPVPPERSFSELPFRI